MTFNSLQFAAAFALLVVVWFRLGRVGQNRLAIVASSVFYGLFDWRFLLLLYVSVAIDYVVTRCMGGTDDPRSRRRLLAVSFTAQLGLLATFKYLDFFRASAEAMLERLGFHPDTATLNIIVPVGISFYTFQTLAYVYAVYRRRLEPERDLVTFAAFVTWFPQLAAGPIERPKSLLSQMQRRRVPPNAAATESGLLLILRGLFKKVVIADGIAGFVNTVYAQPDSYGAFALVLASAAFALQVYADFSGYSDMARGISRLLGVELRRNFEEPFLSRNIQELWQRWHVSLGWWFTEHVLLPLGGARKGPRRAKLNLLVVFALIGLWHGPSWTFVAWGVLNGLLVAFFRRDAATRLHDRDRVRWREAPQIAFTFLLFALGAVFFRSATIGDAFGMLGRIASLSGGLPPPDTAALLPLFVVLVLALDLNARGRRIAARERSGKHTVLGGVATPIEIEEESPLRGLTPIAAGAAVGCGVLALVLFSGTAPVPFIYFKF